MMSGSAVGALLGGAAVTVLGVAGAFAVAVLPLVACLVVDLARPATHYWAAFAPKTPGPDEATDARATAPRPRRRLPTGAGALVVGLVAVSFATFLARFAGEQGLIPVLAYDTGGLTPLTLGVAMAAGTLISIAALPVVGRLVDRGARLSVLLPSALVGAGALMLFPIVSAPLAFGAVIVVYYVSTSVAGVVPNVVTGERFEPAAAGAVVGLTRTAGDVGAAVGPLAVFALADAAGALAAVSVIAAVLVAALVLLAPAVARRPGGA
jgi:MFS family permease